MSWCRRIAVAAALLSTPAAAQTTTFRGPDGRHQGRAETGSDGTTWFYDARGRNAGRAEPGSPGEMRLYDRDGRNAGTTERATPGATTPAPMPRGEVREDRR
jgi:hypothetical protein